MDVALFTAVMAVANLGLLICWALVQTHCNRAAAREIDGLSRRIRELEVALGRRQP